MQLAVDHQHRPGLSGEFGLWLLPEKGRRFEHARTAAAYEEDAVGLQMKVAGAVLGACLGQLAAAFDVKAYGL